jgi:hypothetical protein
MPDQVYTLSTSTLVAASSTPLSGSTNNNGDWYYDNSTKNFSYIGNHFFVRLFIVIKSLVFFSQKSIDK